MSSTSKVYSSLQAGRAIAALMVVLFHCSAIFGELKYWHHPFDKYLVCGHRGVELFFVLSGIVILNAHWADMNNPGALTTYLRKRFLRIYPIYWLVLLFIVPVFILFPAFGTGMERRPSVIVSSFLLVHLFEKATVLTVAWTLYHEVMFYAIFAFLIINRKVGLWILAGWMCCSVYALAIPPGNPVVAVYISPLHLLFCFGMAITLIVRHKRMPVPYLVLVAGTAGFIGGCVYENLSRSEAPVLSVWFGLTASLCALGAIELERSGKLRVPQMFRLLGDASYSIYLVHFPLLSVMAKILYSIWVRTKVPLGILFLTMAVVTTALGVLVHRFVERPLLDRMRTPKDLDGAVLGTILGFVRGDSRQEQRARL